MEDLQLKSHSNLYRSAVKRGAKAQAKKLRRLGLQEDRNEREDYRLKRKFKQRLRLVDKQRKGKG